jgi:hypothetical protein
VQGLRKDEKQAVARLEHPSTPNRSSKVSSALVFFTSDSSLYVLISLMLALISGPGTSFQIIFVLDLHSAYRRRRVPSRLPPVYYYTSNFMYFNSINEFCISLLSISLNLNKAKPTNAQTPKFLMRSIPTQLQRGQTLGVHTVTFIPLWPFQCDAA